MIIYKIVPLIISLSFLYSFLKQTSFIVRKDKQEQKDYEDYIGKRGNWPAILSLIGFLIFAIMFIREIL